MPDNPMNDSKDRSDRPGLGEAAQQARSAASGLATAASDKAQDIASGIADQFEYLIEERKEEGAQQLHRFADAIGRAGGEMREEFPLVARAVERGATELDRLAETIRERDGRTLIAETGELVRRRAGIAAGVMGVMGFAAVRFLMARPPRGAYRDESRYGAEGRDTSDEVQQSLTRSTAGDEDAASGDPGGVAPAAPGFGTTSGAGGTTRELP